MALIEGIGDEVTLLFSSLLLLLVLLLAWISTQITEPPEHLFASSPSLSSHAHQDGLASSSVDPTSSFSSSSVSDSSMTEAPSTNTSSQEEKDEGAGGGDGLRSRGGGGEEEEEEESASTQRNMVVRLKFLNDTETTAQVKPQDTIGYIKRYKYCSTTPCTAVLLSVLSLVSI